MNDRSGRRVVISLSALFMEFILGSAFLPNQGWAKGRIYASPEPGGLTAYTDEPTSPESQLYMTTADPPARPRQRLSSSTLHPSASLRSAYANLVTPTIHQMTLAAAKAYNVPHALLLAVMHAESNFNPAARSPVGAVGLMQIMPPTGARYGVRQNLDDPINNIDVGARYLKDLLALFKNDTELAVAA